MIPYYQKNNVSLYLGDALQVLKELPDESVDMVMTSPPYFCQRNYENHPEQIGQEEHFNDYIKRLCDIFNEVKRVIKKEGNIFVNIDTTFASSGSKRFDDKKYESKNKIQDGRGRINNYPSKCDCLIPERFAIEMVNRGWIKRRTIIWQKPNAMPESIQDDFTLDFEYIYHFVRHQRYYFKQQFESYAEATLKRINYLTYSEKANTGIQGGFTLEKQKKAFEKIKQSMGIGGKKYTDYHSGEIPDYTKGGANKRCVWAIATRHCEKGHYAGYPPDLCEIPIKAGCPPGGVVLDPFNGSGTTGIVALKLGRKYIGIELNEKYLKDITIPRLEREYGLLLQSY